MCVCVCVCGMSHECTRVIFARIRRFGIFVSVRNLHGETEPFNSTIVPNKDFSTCMQKVCVAVKYIYFLECSTSIKHIVVSSDVLTSEFMKIQRFWFKKSYRLLNIHRLFGNIC